MPGRPTHPRSTKRQPDPRALRSGFGTKLRAWLRENERLYEEENRTVGPRNKRQLAKIITEAGEPVTDAAVGWWFKGHGLPDSKYVGILERLMGASWAYIDDARAPWPRPPSDERLRDLLSLIPPQDLERYFEDLRREIAARLAARRQ